MDINGSVSDHLLHDKNRDNKKKTDNFKESVSETLAARLLTAYTSALRCHPPLLTKLSLEPAAAGGRGRAGRREVCGLGSVARQLEPKWQHKRIYAVLGYSHQHLCKLE